MEPVGQFILFITWLNGSVTDQATTIANNSMHEQQSAAPHSSGSLGLGGLGNQVRGNDKQVNNNNMTDIYDML